MEKLNSLKQYVMAKRLTPNN